MAAMNTRAKTVLEAERMATFVRFRHLYLWLRVELETAGKNLSGLLSILPPSETPHSAFGDVMGDHLATTAPSAAQLRELLENMRMSSVEMFDAIEEVAKVAETWQTADAAWRLTEG